MWAKRARRMVVLGLNGRAQLGELGAVPCSRPLGVGGDVSRSSVADWARCRWGSSCRVIVSVGGGKVWAVLGRTTRSGGDRLWQLPVGLDLVPVGPDVERVET